MDEGRRAAREKGKGSVGTAEMCVRASDGRKGCVMYRLRKLATFIQVNVDRHTVQTLWPSLQTCLSLFSAGSSIATNGVGHPICHLREVGDGLPPLYPKF